MGFFDFIADIPPYSGGEAPERRLNRRHALIVEPYRDRIKGARVLDIAAHDGRWSYALAGAGAREVVGVEARAELIERFAAFPETDFKARISLQQGDLWDYLEGAVDGGERFDVVALFGIYYHVMDHFRLLQLVRRLEPKLVLIDSEFMLVKNPMIQLVMERTELSLNAAPQIEGQERAIKGIPSFRAMNRMAEALNYGIEWADTEAVFGADKKGVQDYFRRKSMRRAACALTPL